jgi:hypothetical protein
VSTLLFQPLQQTAVVVVVALHQALEMVRTAVLEVARQKMEPLASAHKDLMEDLAIVRKTPAAVEVVLVLMVKTAAFPAVMVEPVQVQALTEHLPLGAVEAAAVAIQQPEPVAQAAAVTVRLEMLTAQMVRLTPVAVEAVHATPEAAAVTVEQVAQEF